MAEILEYRGSHVPEGEVGWGLTDGEVILRQTKGEPNDSLLYMRRARRIRMGCLSVATVTVLGVVLLGNVAALLFRDESQPNSINPRQVVMALVAVVTVLSPVLLIAAFLLQRGWSRLKHEDQESRAEYVLTDRRLLVRRPGAKFVGSYPLAMFEHARAAAHRDGTGDIYLGDDAVVVSIPDPAEFLQAIHHARQNPHLARDAGPAAAAPGCASKAL